jgi:hypothetical protein
MVFALYHPAAALRAPSVELASYADIALVPAALDSARTRRTATAASTVPADVPAAAAHVMAAPAAPVTPASPTRPMTDQATPEPPALDQLTLFR